MEWNFNLDVKSDFIHFPRSSRLNLTMSDDKAITWRNSLFLVLIWFAFSFQSKSSQTFLHFTLMRRRPLASIVTNCCGSHGRERGGFHSTLKESTFAATRQPSILIVLNYKAAIISTFFRRCLLRQWDQFMKRPICVIIKLCSIFVSENPLRLCTAILCMHIELKLLLPPRAHADQSV